MYWRSGAMASAWVWPTPAVRRRRRGGFAEIWQANRPRHLWYCTQQQRAGGGAPGALHFANPRWLCPKPWTGRLGSCCGLQPGCDGTCASNTICAALTFAQQHRLEYSSSSLAQRCAAPTLAVSFLQALHTAALQPARNHDRHRFWRGGSERQVRARAWGVAACRSESAAETAAA